MPSEMEQIKELRQIIAKKDEQIQLLKKVNIQLEANLKTSEELRVFLNGKVQGMMELSRAVAEVLPWH